jgi:ribose transport system permease protein
MSSFRNKIAVRVTGLLKEPEITVVVALLMLFIILSITAPRFLTSYNLFSILRQSSIIGIVAMGQTLALIVGGFDLSIGSVAGLGGIVTGAAMVDLGLPLPLCIMLGILVGAACGYSNGLIITKIGISPLIVTLGTALIFKGLILVTTRGYPILKFPLGFYFLGQGYLGPVPLPVIIMLLTGALCHTFLSLTRFGNHIYAVGSNEDTSYLFGIKVHRVQILTYTICGGIAAFGGLILASRLSSAQPSAGQGMVLPSIAIAVIGGTKLGGGTGRISGTILGAVLIGAMNNALVLLGVSPYVQDIVSGAIVIVAVAVDKVRRGR